MSCIFCADKHHMCVLVFFYDSVTFKVKFKELSELSVIS